VFPLNHQDGEENTKTFTCRRAWSHPQSQVELNSSPEHHSCLCFTEHSQIGFLLGTDANYKAILQDKSYCILKILILPPVNTCIRYKQRQGTTHHSFNQRIKVLWQIAALLKMSFQMKIINNSQNPFHSQDTGCSFPCTPHLS
jgi:hypothetical protein